MTKQNTEVQKDFGNHLICRFIFHLELLPVELLVYTMIHSFSRDGIGIYYGRKKFISEALRITEKTVGKAMKSLLMRGLIEKCTLNGSTGFRCTQNTEIYLKAKQNFPDSFGSESEEGKKCEDKTRRGSDKPNSCAQSLCTKEAAIQKAHIDKAAAFSEDNRSACENYPIAHTGEMAALPKKRSEEEENAERIISELLPFPKDITREERLRRTVKIREVKKPFCIHAEECTGVLCGICTDGDMFNTDWLDDYKDYDVKPKRAPELYIPKYEYATFGLSGKVKLTWEQHAELTKLIPKEELSEYIQRLDNYLSKPHDTPINYHSHYRQLKKWIIEDHGT